MQFKAAGPFLALLAFATVAAAQPTKVSGTFQCPKPEIQQAIPTGDDPGHVFSIYKVNCNWTKPMDIAGSGSKTGSSIGFDEIRGSSAKGHGEHVSILANGEKTFVRFQGSTILKDGAPQSAQGTWNYTGGTGSVKGIKGKGTYKGKWSSDGSITYEVEGDYEIPKK
jgi:hypothetical protein